MQHDECGSLVKIIEKADQNGVLRVETLNGGRAFYCKKDELKDVTIDLWLEKTENVAFFFAGMIAFVLMVSNQVNDGQWSGTAVWAFISFAMFTIYRIKED